MEIKPVSEYWDEIVKSRVNSYVGVVFRVPPRLWREMSMVQCELKAADKRQIFADPSTFHVTIKGLGLLGEKFDQEKLEAILKKINEITSRFHPFEIRFRGLGIFPTTIYARVEDPEGKLKLINKTLAKDLALEIDSSEYDGDSYIPHVSLLTFTTKGADELVRMTNSDSLKEIALGECTVFEIEAVEANLFYALGPKDTQDRAFGYLRSFQLGSKSSNKPHSRLSP